jgi:hypothetical protein
MHMHMYMHMYMLYMYMCMYMLLLLLYTCMFVCCCCDMCMCMLHAYVHVVLDRRTVSERRPLHRPAPEDVGGVPAKYGDRIWDGMSWDQDGVVPLGGRR